MTDTSIGVDSDYDELAEVGSVGQQHPSIRVSIDAADAAAERAP